MCPVLFIERGNVARIHAHLFCLENAPDDLAAPGLGERIRKLDLRGHGNRAKRDPDMVNQTRS